MKTTLVVPTLNEIEGMKTLMPLISRGWFEQIIVSDGGSTDGTVEWARENGYQIHVQKKKGIRFAYLEILGMLEGDVILTFSPDGNCPVDAIPKLIEKMREGYDLVIGSRYAENAKSEDDDLVTGFGNWLFTRTVNILHRAHFTDSMVIFRAFKRQLIYDLDLDKEESYLLPERLFGAIISWEPLMSVRAAKRKLKIADVAVGEPPRLGGERKLRIWRWGAAYYFQIWSELFLWR